MSDEFLKNKTYQNSNLIYQPSALFSETSETDRVEVILPRESTPTTRASARRIGDLLVEAYGAAVLNRKSTSGPEKVVLEYTNFLVRGCRWPFNGDP